MKSYLKSIQIIGIYHPARGSNPIIYNRDSVSDLWYGKFYFADYSIVIFKSQHQED